MKIHRSAVVKRILFGNSKPDSGFTLIELLVVVAIIAVLAAIVAMNVTSAGPTARDGRRKSDVKTVEASLEQFYSENHKYPVTYPTELLTGNFMTQEPLDPSTKLSYAYSKSPSLPVACDNTTPAKSCTDFCVYAKLEKNPGSGTGNYKKVTPLGYYYLACSSNTYLGTFLAANTWIAAP